MGLLIDGVWRDQWYDTKSTGGRFVRKDSHFRNWVTEDGGAGPSGSGGFPAARGRYHLYVSLACPWAHRTLIMRSLKGLDEVISKADEHVVTDLDINGNFVVFQGMYGGHTDVSQALKTYQNVLSKWHGRQALELQSYRKWAKDYTR